MAKADKNTAWSREVKRLMRKGYGVEDVAVILKCDLQYVRDEVQILREEGRIEEIVFRHKARGLHDGAGDQEL